MLIKHTYRFLLFALSLTLIEITYSKDTAKIVFIAGNKSHGWGAHEFNAGSLLMEAHLKEALGSKIETVVHKNELIKMSSEAFRTGARNPGISQ